MIRSVNFWILLVAFQVVFGLMIFAFTRQYYLHGPDSISVQPKATRQQPPEWPDRSMESDLEAFLSSPTSGATVNDPEALLRQANEFFADGRYDEAADRYARALASGANNVNTHNSLGITLHYLGRSTEALRILNQGISLDPTYQRIWLTLGFVNSQTGNIEQARKALTTAVQMGADNDIGQSAAEMLEKLP